MIGFGGSFGITVSIPSWDEPESVFDIDLTSRLSGRAGIGLSLGVDGGIVASKSADQLGNIFKAIKEIDTSYTTGPITAGVKADISKIE